VDECTTDDHECHANAECTDTTKAYTCACKPGYNDPADDPADYGKNCIGDGKVKIAVAIKTSVEWDDDLSDPDSVKFAQEKSKLEAELKAADAYSQATLGFEVTITVTGFTKVGGRKRRSGGDVASAQVEVEASGEDAGAGFQNVLEQATQAAVDNTAGLSGTVSAVTLVDECSDDSLNNCDPNASCTDTVDYYTCTCNDNYWGTGQKVGETAGCTEKFDECTTDDVNKKHNCKADIEVCVDTDESFICQCAEGKSRLLEDTDDGSKGECADQCNLFTIECDVAKGFTIKVNDKCRTAQYNLEESDYTKLFVSNVDLKDETDLAAKKAGTTMDDYLDGIDTNCKFNADGEVEVKFDQCGGFFVHSSPTDPDDQGKYYTVFTTFVNHRQELNDVWVSRLDQTQLECRLQHVEIDSADAVDISDNDENDGISTILSDKLIADFSLALEVGSCDTADDCDTFTAYTATAEVDVGQNVNVKLDFDDSTDSFTFVMRECSVSAQDAYDADLGTIPLFDTATDKLHCPNTDSSILGLVWRDYDRYSLNVFRVGDAESLTFSCKVAIYPKGKAPDACPDNSGGGRRRRALDFNPEGQVTKEISKTIHLSKNNKDSGARSLYADFVMSTIFALALL